MDLKDFTLNSIHQNGDEDYSVEERIDEHDTIFVKLKKVDDFDKPLSEA